MLKVYDFNGSLSRQCFPPSPDNLMFCQEASGFQGPLYDKTNSIHIDMIRYVYDIIQLNYEKLPYKERNIGTCRKLILPCGLVEFSLKEYFGR